VARGLARAFAAYFSDLLLWISIAGALEVAAVVGMDPSPSCGVTAAKGKPAMLGVSPDTAEVPGSGLFFDSLRDAAAERRVTLPPLVGVRRVLSPAEGDPRGLDDLRRVLGVKQGR